MLVRAGSVISTATCRSASAASTEARSFHSTARVVAAGSTAGATFPARLTVPAVPRAPRTSRRRCRGSCTRSTPPAAAGDQAGQPQRPAVRVRGGQANDQRGTPNRAGQLAGHPRGVFGGEHGGDAAELLEPLAARRPRWPAASGRPWRRCRRGRSRRSVCPSRSVTRLPAARSRKIGNPPAHLAIQVIGTPPTRCSAATAAAAADRGRAAAKAPRSRSSSVVSRVRSTAPIVRP